MILRILLGEHEKEYYWLIFYMRSDKNVDIPPNGTTSDQ